MQRSPRKTRPTTTTHPSTRSATTTSPTATSPLAITSPKIPSPVTGNFPVNVTATPATATTTLVDAYMTTIALSLLDESRLLRRKFSQLILQDCIKWSESLLRFFLRAAVDEDANLAHHALCGSLLQKSPHIFTNEFSEMTFVFNGIQGDKSKFSEP
ncbi:hypothetical protein V7S43_011196 [Phytophthora oleae]|uniref:PDEase domain-containing protein n=1 Tax=Phytophthora oleae TaxID=2107226 RepID=A0ABD3FAA5_9STRA